MYLENLVFDAVEPQRLGRFWEAVVGAERLTDEPDAFETRLTVEGGPVLDPCFQRAPSRQSTGRGSIWTSRAGPARPRRSTAARIGRTKARYRSGRCAMGGARRPGGQSLLRAGGSSGVPGTGPVAALPLDSADPDRDAEFWSWLTGWADAAGVAPRSLRHPSLLGPLLELCPEQARKGTTKNRLHLDIRLETGDDPDGVAASIVERGGRELHPEWGELPWRVYADPSGNEFCVLPARS